MNRFLLLATVFGLSAVATASTYLSPETISLTPDASALVVAEKRACRVTVRQLDGTVIRALEATKKVGGLLRALCVG